MEELELSALAKLLEGRVARPDGVDVHALLQIGQFGEGSRQAFNSSVVIHPPNEEVRK